MKIEPLLLVLELDRLADLEEALQSYRDERLILHGPSEFRARTRKKLRHRTQVRVKTSRLPVNQALERSVRIVAEGPSLDPHYFSFCQSYFQSRLARGAFCAANI